MADAEGAAAPGAGDTDGDLQKYLRVDEKPLPKGWTKCYHGDGRVYFVDDINESTSWLDPRTHHVDWSKRIEGLPPGWEEAETNQGIVFYEDYNKGRCTWKHPLTGEFTDPLLVSGKVVAGEEQPPSDLTAGKSGRKASILKQDPRSHFHAQVSVAELRNPEMSGWMTKMGGSGIRTNWRRRWFVLKDFCLYYYKSPEDTQALGKLPLPSYQVSPATPQEKISKKHAFKVHHGGMRTYWFHAESRESQLQWMNALSLAAIFQDPRLTLTQQTSGAAAAAAAASPSMRRRVSEMSLSGHVPGVSDLVVPASPADAAAEGLEAVPEDSPAASAAAAAAAGSAGAGSAGAKEAESGDGGAISSKPASVERHVSVDAFHETVHESSALEEDGARSREELWYELGELRAETQRLREERDRYKGITQTTKANLVELKRSMFETFEMLQKELYEEQEQNARLTERVEALDDELAASRPAVAMVDSVVALSRAVADENASLIQRLEQASALLRSASEKARDGPSNKLLQFGQQLRQEHTQLGQFTELKNFLESEGALLESKLGDLEELEERVQEATAAIGELHAERDALLRRLEEERAAGSAAAAEEAQAALEAVQQRLASNEALVTDASSKNAELEAEVAALQSKLAAAEKFNAEVGAKRKEEAHADREQLEGELRVLRQQLQSEVRENEAMHGDLQRMQDELLAKDAAAAAAAAAATAATVGGAGTAAAVPADGGDAAATAAATAGEQGRTPQLSAEEQQEVDHAKTRLDLEMEMRALKRQLEEERAERERMRAIEERMASEKKLRAADGSRVAPSEWVRTLRIPAAEDRWGAVRDAIEAPEKLSFQDKLRLFLDGK